MAGKRGDQILLAQASQWRRLGETFPDQQPELLLRLYAQLIDLPDMVVDVDILSAGGINAALLVSS